MKLVLEKLGFMLLLISCSSSLETSKKGYMRGQASLKGTGDTPRTALRANSILECSVQSGSGLSYRWLGVAGESTSNTYTVTEDDVGNEISCEVILKDSEGRPTKARSEAIKIVANDELCGYATADSFTIGSGTVSDPYVICNKSHFDLIRNNMSVHYELRSDIDLSTDNDVTNALGTGFIPIGLDITKPNEATSFTGSLVGNGFTIKNSTSDLKAKYNAIFAKVESASFSNIKFENISNTGTVDTVVTETNTGILAAHSIGTSYTDITVISSEVNGTYAGFIATADGSSHNFKNLDITLDVTSSLHGGALAGEVKSAFDSDNVKINTVSSTSGTMDPQRLGGMIGLVEPPEGTSSTIKNSEFTVTLTNTTTERSFVGGVIGVINQDGGGDVSIDQLTVAGNIVQEVGTESRAGGLVSNVGRIASFDVQNVRSSVAIISNAEYVGGLVGILYRTTASISDTSVTNQDLVVNTSDYCRSSSSDDDDPKNKGTKSAGGLVGRVSATKITVANSDSSANVRLTAACKINGETRSVGGLIGEFIVKQEDASYTNATYQLDNVNTSGSLTLDRSNSAISSMAGGMAGGIGGLFGRITNQRGGNSHIKNSVSSVSISGNFVESVGGLIGRFKNNSSGSMNVLIDSSSYQNTSKTAININGTKWVAGFIGEANGGDIFKNGGSFRVSNSYAKAGITFNITADDQQSIAAGFIGIMKNGGTIEKSYAEGTIDFNAGGFEISSGSGDWIASGFLGHIRYDSGSTEKNLQKVSIDDSYSKVGISVSSDNISTNTNGRLFVAGLVGKAENTNSNPNDISLNNVYYYTNKFEIIDASTTTDCTMIVVATNCGIDTSTPSLQSVQYGGLMAQRATNLNNPITFQGYDNLGFLSTTSVNNAKVLVYQGDAQTDIVKDQDTDMRSAINLNVPPVMTGDPPLNTKPPVDWSLSNLRNGKMGSWSSDIWQDNSSSGAPPTLK